MSAAGVSAEYPCPCENCDRFAMSHDEYCITCLHYDCQHDRPLCPGPLQVNNCETCGREYPLKVLNDRLCPGCHHRKNPGESVPINTPQSRLAHFLKVADVRPEDGGAQ